MKRADPASPQAGIRGGAPTLDWSFGCYESTAEQTQLLPAAQAVVHKAAIGRNDRVLDLGCGTGNAALLAAGHARQVTGVDPAVRLLDVAKRRAASERKTVTFLPGDAASVPLPDSSVDVIVSVFAVIFAPDPAAAALEMTRVLSPAGRIVLSAWVPAGTMFAMTSAAGNAVRQALGAPEPAPFAWHDRDALTALFAPHGLRFEVERHDLAFTAPSAKDFLDLEGTNHPVALAGIRVLEQLGQADAVRAQLLAILEEGNEDHERFRITSPYVIAHARRENRQDGR
jgi:SAM-dependent methyltransferase